MIDATMFMVPIDRTGAMPLWRQIYGGVREAILDGRLGPGSRLPSTRTLASDLGVARNTVLIAFEQLIAEGYLESTVGAGTRVSDLLPGQFEQIKEEEPRAIPSRDRPISSRARILEPQASGAVWGRPRSFQVGIPAVDQFPTTLWGRLSARAWRRASSEVLSYGDPRGYRPLREAITAYLKAARGVSCDPDQVVIVGGSQQALDLVARVLLDPCDAVGIEEPGYLGARAAFQGAGASLHPVLVDENGANIETFDSRVSPRVVYVTPSNQFPTGSTMSVKRRLALLRWAQSTGAWVIEDDYDSEFRYDSSPLMALQGLDEDGRVIYVGTFSKTLSPALRLGYLVLPKDLIDPFLGTRIAVDQHSPVFDQLALTEFMKEGHFSRHIRRMRRLYEERQKLLVTACREELRDFVDIGPSASGMQLLAHLRSGMDDTVVNKRARERDVYMSPLSIYYLTHTPTHGLNLGYAAFNERAIREGVAKLKEVFLDLTLGE